MRQVKERLDSVEEIIKELAINQLKLSKDVRQLGKEMKEFKDEMKEFKDEMKEFKDEMKKFRTEMEIKWGNLANSLGIVVEAIIAPGFPELLEKEFGCMNMERLMVNVEVRKPRDKHYLKEFDLIAVCGDLVFLNETKPRIKEEYVIPFVKFVESGEFFDYFPEYKGKHLVPVVSSLRMKPHEVQILTKHKIFAVTLKHSSLKVENYSKAMKHYPFLSKKTSRST